MSQQHNIFGSQPGSDAEGRTLIDALEHAAAHQVASTAPVAPSAFMHAVRRRRHARWATNASLALVPVLAVAAAAVCFWPSHASTIDDPQIAVMPPTVKPISPTPTAAELARVNRGRSGDALVLPETTGFGGDAVTAGTRLDSPAAAQVVK